MTREAKTPLEINLYQTVFTAFDQKINEIHGVGFADLAVERPVDAYSYVTRFSEGVAGIADSVSVDGMKLTKKLDGEQAVTGAARHLVEEMKVDTDIQPVDVVVSVFGKPRFIDLVRGRKTPPIEVISFHVEPPNLSF